MGNYRWFLNTDIEIEIFSSDYNELFLLLTNCFGDIVSYKKDTNQISKELYIEVEDKDLLPVDYFNELIYLLDRDGFVAVGGRFKIEGDSFSALLDGFIAKRDDIKKLPKAATYHDYRFEKTDEGFYLKMIVDI